jgi:hypothetical protein
MLKAKWKFLELTNRITETKVSVDRCISKTEQRENKQLEERIM